MQRDVLEILTNNVGVPTNASVYKALGGISMPVTGANTPATQNVRAIMIQDNGAFLIMDKFHTLEKIPGVEHGDEQFYAFATVNNGDNVILTVRVYFDINQGIAGYKIAGLRSDAGDKPVINILIGNETQIYEDIPIIWNSADLGADEGSNVVLGRILLGDYSWMFVGNVIPNSTTTILFLREDHSVFEPYERPSVVRRSGSLIGLVAAYLPYSHGVQSALQVSFDAAVAQFKLSADKRYCSR